MTRVMDDALCMNQVAENLVSSCSFRERRPLFGSRQALRSWPSVLATSQVLHTSKALLLPSGLVTPAGSLTNILPSFRRQRCQR